jgi:outer membrane protein assembly factor BamA
VTLYVGEGLKSIQIVGSNLDKNELSKVPLLKSNLNKEVGLKKVEQIKKYVVQQYENTGYPFAEVRLDSFSDNLPLTAQIVVEKNELLKWDSLRIEPKAKVKKIFLRNYLGIKPGKVYSESTFRKIDGRLRLLPFVETVRATEVVFETSKAIPQIFIKDRKANQFDLLIGLLPGSSNQKVLVTADIMLHLVSPFGLGEEFRLKWQKLQPKTQTLEVQIVYPYLIGLPIGINASFDLHKVDTSFLNIGGDYGFQYQLQGPDIVKASYRNRSTIILNTDTNFIKTNRVLPPNIDVTSNQFALELFLQHLNYRFNPSAGYTFRFGGSFGVKAIKKSNSIASLYDEQTQATFESLYDSVRLKTFIFELSLMVDKYWKINNRNTIRTYFEAKYLYNKRITDNELYRIGGLNSLRGFDDRSILSPYYGFANLEYRFLLSKNAFFFLFFNGGLVKEYRNFQQRPFDFPFGFGAGTTIETRIGMFALSYAMGRQQDEKITFRNAKIHFGYINYF